MASLLKYLQIATDVYADKSDTPPSVNDFVTQKFEYATWYGNGFQGGVFVNKTEIIVGFSGTKGSPTSAPISQTSGNARIALHVIPNMAGGAFDMVNWAKSIAKGRPISIVGHSLGGGLAQVVGNWSGCPFISFNGPGMANHLKLSSFNIFKPRQMYRSIRSASTGDTRGICFFVTGDLTGTYGEPVGWGVELEPEGATSLLKNHGLEAVRSGIQKKGWLRNEPREIYSIFC